MVLRNIVVMSGFVPELTSSRDEIGFGNVQSNPDQMPTPSLCSLRFALCSSLFTYSLSRVLL